jgi:hypothetical protein
MQIGCVEEFASSKRFLRRQVRVGHPCFAQKPNPKSKNEKAITFYRIIIIFWISFGGEKAKAKLFGKFSSNGSS